MGQAVAQKTEPTDDRICKAILLYCSQYSKGNGNRDGEEKPNRRPKSKVTGNLRERPKTPLHRTDSFCPYPPEHAPQPPGVLGEKGLIQPRFFSGGVHGLLGQGDTGVLHFLHHSIAPGPGASWQRTKSDGQQNGDQLQDSLEGVSSHDSLSGPGRDGEKWGGIVEGVLFGIEASPDPFDPRRSGGIRPAAKAPHPTGAGALLGTQFAFHFFILPPELGTDVFVGMVGRRSFCSSRQ